MLHLNDQEQNPFGLAAISVEETSQQSFDSCGGVGDGGDDDNDGGDDDDD